MDTTPKKIQIISTPLSKFEDSPVFNFINSLSPIKPLKSSHFTRAFDPLNFSSPPSVFTSPHISSLKESGILKRPHSCSEPVDSGRNDASEVPPSEAASVVTTVQCAPQEVLLCTAETHLHGECQFEQNKEITGCDWESLISDTAELMIFSSTEAAEAFKSLIQKSLPLEQGVEFCTSLACSFEASGINDLSSGLPCHPDEQGSELLLPNNEDGQLEEMDKADSEVISNLHRGISRRCLDFETLGGQIKHSDGNPKTVSSVNKQLVTRDPSNASSKCILPGIGLHLNALAKRSCDDKDVKQETLSSGRQKVSFPNSRVYIRPLTTGQEDIHEGLTHESTEKETIPSEDRRQLAENASEPPPNVINEELSQSSPKKKRRKSEAGEAESCKRCNCKKSKCLKLYCECFAAGIYCIEPCSCQDCYNKPIHEDTVLATRKQIESRNPLAFAPKVIRSSDSVPEGDDSSKTPASSRHKRGCNCKKSSCLKKYCECYQSGVGCSINCRCEGCKNAFGTKDGPIAKETENEQEEETDMCEESMAEKALQKAEMFNNEEQNIIPTLPEFYTGELVQPPFSLKNEFPRSLVAVGSSCGVLIGQGYGKSNVLKPETKRFPNVGEDEMMETFGAHCSPTTTTIKSLSPNSKRICLPNLELRSTSTPGRRSSRKLILQSIPSFPSLTSHQ